MVLKKLRKKIKKVVKKVKKKFKKKAVGRIAPKRTTSFQGPTRPSTDVRTFRATGRSVPKRTTSFQGPTRSSIDVRAFTGTGRIVPMVSQPPQIKKVVTRRQIPPRRPVSTVERVKLPEKRIPRVLSKLSTRRFKLRTESFRKKKGELKRQIELGGITFATSVLGALQGLKQLPSTFVSLVKDPSQIKEVPANLKRSGVEFGRLLKVSPTEGLVKVGAEIFILKGTGKTLQVTGKLSSNARAILSPKFKGVNPKVIDFKSARGGTTQIKVAGPLKTLREPLKKQVKLAGKKVTGVSAQADRLVNLIRKKRIIRKPIPKEADLSPATKKLLKKFDSGKITKKQFVKLENALNVKGQSLLERSFFADPRGRFRPSRLGAEPGDASLLDVLTGDVTFKTSRPQILVFEKIGIQKFPKTKKFNIIKKKLKTGKTLTSSEAKELLKFQSKISGKFKPVGSLTTEPEITLAPGELIKRDKLVGRAIINGRAVPIIRVKIVKPSKSIKKLLLKSKEGKLTVKEAKLLRKKLQKETGFKPKLSRRKGVRKVIRQRPLFRGRRRSRGEISKKIRTPTKRRPSRPRGRNRRGPPTTPPKRPTQGRPTRGRNRRGPPTTTLRGSPRGSPRIGPPIKPVPRIRKKRPSRKRPSRKPSFNVFARPLKRTKKGRRPKLIKINKVPLSKRRAKDLRNLVVDTSLSRTARIKPTRGKPSSPQIKVPKGFARRTSKKFRRFKQRKGKRVPLPKGKVIERGRFLLDTRQEKRQITLKKRIAQLKKPSKRKATPSQLMNLAKGRKILKDKRKK